MKLLLLDGHNLLYRSFVTLPRSITDRAAEPINGLYGLLGTIIKLNRELDPQHVVATFDVPDVPTFRHHLYPAYQAQRGPLGGEHAQEFVRQVAMAQESLPKLGIPSITCPGFEADDVLGSIANQIANSGGMAGIVSTDRDVLQLVRTGIEVITPGRELPHIRDATGVQERLGVGPEGVTTFKALAGDASDNIPGVAGIGTKTATTLVNHYGTLESIYLHLDELPRAAGNALRAGRDEAFLFRRLVTIATDLDIPLALDQLPLPRLDGKSEIREVLTNLGYRGDVD